MTGPNLPTIDELPFEERYEGHADWLDGIEKVRAFSDPAMRQTVYDLHADLARKAWVRMHGSKPKEPEQQRLVDDESERKYP